MITKNYEKVLRYRIISENIPAYAKLSKLPTQTREQKQFVILHSKRAIEKYKELIAKARSQNVKHEKERAKQPKAKVNSAGKKDKKCKAC